jgi:hypothetical protein
VATPIADIRRAELATPDSVRTAAVVMAVVAGLAIAVAIGATHAQPELGDKPIW